MKKKSLILLLAATAVSNILFSSYMGSFDLTSKLLTWNRSINSRFVNKLVFIAFWIVPVYEISALADVLVINSIEFWNGGNPIADTDNIKTIDGKDGVYTVKTKADRYHTQKEGDEKAVDLVFNEVDRSWSVEADGKSTKLLKSNGDDEAVMYLPDGKEMNVELDQTGVLAFQQVADGYSYYAAR